MRILRSQDRVLSPWKNGGGTTAEVAAFPEGASLENFGWRVSIADVRQGGPFSQFPGIDRRLAILKGRLSLAIDGRDAAVLSPQTTPIEFPGDVPASATLIDGPVTDLNVMTRRGVFASRMSRETAATLKFDSDTSISIAVFLADSHIQDDVKTKLHAGDALMADAGQHHAVAFARATEFYWIQIAECAAS